MSNMKNIRFYITPPHPCSYLDDRSARMVFIDPIRTLNISTFSELSRQGFRRSGDFIYKPECQHCRQCLSSRIPAERFEFASKYRRILNHNKDLRMAIRPTSHATVIHYHLYARYIEERHADGDMYPPTREQFDKFLVTGGVDSFFLEFWLHDRLMVVATCDPLDDGISAVYTFFDPDENKRSLGTFSILQQIKWASSHNLDFVYLGYWVPQAEKMRYKSNFLPLEVLLDGHWQRLSRTMTESETTHLIKRLSRDENIQDYKRLR
jgi:arginyl-tRNA--protein-N-Asp/Glu arginylyltransferase